MTITIQVRFFAALREAVGASALSLQTHAGTVGALRDELIGRGSPWAEALARGKSVRASVDHAMADDATPLRAGAEVAFFPPVTGG
jgi:molybdopterin synthase sulfur carrier subunit